MLSAIILATLKGDILLRRDYKADVKKKDIQTWLSKVVLSREFKDRAPVLTFDSRNHFIYVVTSEVVIAALTRENSNVVSLVDTLNKLMDIFRYFTGEVTETSVRRNVSVYFCILDEAIDFGVPQFLDRDTLKSLILPGSDDVTQKTFRDITAQVTGAVSWRAPNLRYRRNEVYIDVLESVNALISSSGEILGADVAGQVIVKSNLSGMPECRFGINDKVQVNALHLDDMRFHQCVKESASANARCISFVPPDGVFQLMVYRISKTVTLPMRISPVIHQSGGKLEATIKLKAAFPKNLQATNIIVTIPAPPTTAQVKIISSSSGKGKYEPAKGAVLWAIRRMQGETELVLTLEIDAVAPSTSTNQRSLSKGLPPISLQFELPMFTASGLRVRFLKIHERSGYKAVKWIRYVTRAGLYHRRL
eukprot:Blabericola_migrator_1__11419@NODE_678_length_6912_cov_111_209642_g492_i0_p2_GENE_NODE_678_length_6912_cov_111_209642_g492_i0NODE_678_length_6912_cov_111_209642_g492_i0_p2_ORF_typecomplete_len421_score70_42Adap_comp_sub/PF00928_21/6_3e78Clat_adaptor_s/PF01217_20/2_2e15muHD/PF10291_9/5_9e06ox_reductase_C/PF08635_10/0_047KN17_SH3/PF18131_1/0_17_NODE_678_length_6912_cov_111_209642_g492_i021243386